MTMVWPASCCSRRRSITVCERRGVERAGRLVGQEQVGPVRQRPADRHALLLAAGEGARQGVVLVGEAERFEQLGRARLRLSPASTDEALRQLDVRRDVEMRDEVVLLEDVADLLASEDGPGGDAQPADVVVPEEDRALVRVVEAHRGGGAASTCRNRSGP